MGDQLSDDPMTVPGLYWRYCCDPDGIVGICWELCVDFRGELLLWWLETRRRNLHLFSYIVFGDDLLVRCNDVVCIVCTVIVVMSDCEPVNHRRAWATPAGWSSGTGTARCSYRATCRRCCRRRSGSRSWRTARSPTSRPTARVRDGGRGGDREGAAASSPFDPVSAAKGAYKHFMLKEIMEQPECVMDTFRGRAVFDPPGIALETSTSTTTCCGRSRSVLIGMGTSSHAAMVGRTYLERIAGVPSEVDNSSEFRYRDALIGPEDAGRLGGAVRRNRGHAGGDGGRETAGRAADQICNTPGAQTTRVADGCV